MNKVLVKVCVPAMGGSYDMFLPVDVPIRDVSRVMADGVTEITNGKYLTSEYEQLCQAPSGLLNPSLTLEDYGIKDGMQLFLI